MKTLINIIILSIITLSGCNIFDNEPAQSKSIISQDKIIDKIRNLYNEVEYKISRNEYKSKLVEIEMRKFNKTYRGSLLVTFYWDYKNNKLVKTINIQSAMPFRYISAYYFYPNGEAAFSYWCEETDSGIIKYYEQRAYYFNKEIIRIIIDDDKKSTGNKKRIIYNKPLPTTIIKDTDNQIKWANFIYKYFSENII